MQHLRLDRVLADCGVSSRKDIKSLIRKGRVTVNGAAVTDPGYKILPDSQSVAVDGVTIKWSKRIVYVINKPAGVITATEDKKLPTVMDLLPENIRRMGLFPVGRLDRDVEGLLLLTNDGTLAHDLLAPKKHVDKLYEAILDKATISGAEHLFKEGLVLEDGTKCRPAKLELMPFAEQDGNPRITARLTIHEGKYHQVKRMFLAVGSRVMYLRRLRMGPVSLDESLTPGSYRLLTEAEVESLINWSEARHKDGV